MALTKDLVVDTITILETGHIEVRRATYFVEDGVRAPNPSYQRVAYEPGVDVAAEDVRVRAVAALIWTPAVIAAHIARKAATALLR